MPAYALIAQYQDVCMVDKEDMIPLKIMFSTEQEQFPNGSNLNMLQERWEELLHVYSDDDDAISDLKQVYRHLDGERRSDFCVIVKREEDASNELLSIARYVVVKYHARMHNPKRKGTMPGTVLKYMLEKESSMYEQDVIRNNEGKEQVYVRLDDVIALKHTKYEHDLENYLGEIYNSLEGIVSRTDEQMPGLVLIKLNKNFKL